MCSGGRLLADFWAGAGDPLAVPDVVQPSLTWTADGAWVVWAHKVARSRAVDRFTPLTGGEPYPVDAVAKCRWDRHDAPQPSCTCGFHAVSCAASVPGRIWLVTLDVALSGRVLAFEWPGGGVLFRAARQTVIRVTATEPLARPVRPLPPDDPDGRLALRAGNVPRGAGPFRLRLARSTPPLVAVADDAGYCAVDHRPLTRHVDPVLTGI
jgi:hypothetical protein